MKNRLLWKLLLTNIVPVIGVIILVVWWAIDQLAASYFMDLMDKYAISPTDIHQMFLTSIHHYLLWASGVALVVALILSYLLTRRVLRPLSQMTKISRQVAAGDFSSRVDISTKDEVGELGLAFNQMADSLAKVEQLRKNMVADLAHELRTPLTNLSGYLEALNDGVLQPSHKNLAMLQQESSHLVKLVDNLQQLARADAAKAYLNREEVDIVAEIMRMQALYKQNFKDKNIKVATDFKSFGLVAADRDKLLQALRNLFENCWKYTPEGGTVQLHAEHLDDMIKITFANSGSLIDDNDLPFIFERFFRADRSRTRVAGGAGIGLSITKELIEAHGGRVGADSDETGTRVWFTLPY